MRGILLAGGSGSRLRPVTSVISKQLLPIFDKPMVYYPLSTLMLAGIQEILVISTPRDLPAFRELLGNGRDWGIDLSFAEQRSPRGIAEALLIGDEFIADEPSALILGDNIFHGPGMGVSLAENSVGGDAKIFAYEVADPREYAVVSLDAQGRPVSLEEKPEHPKSRLAVPGLYFYPPGASAVAQSMTPSGRGELEISDVNRWYLEAGRLSVIQLPRGTAWLDTGTHLGLNDASNYVRVLEERQGVRVACPEEVAWRQGWISDDQLKELALPLLQSGYGRYLFRCLDE